MSHRHGFPLKRNRPPCCGSVWRVVGEVGSRAIGRVFLLKRIREFGKRIRHFECTSVYGGIYMCYLMQPCRLVACSASRSNRCSRKPQQRDVS